jgi:hypothetical protein
METDGDTLANDLINRYASLAYAKAAEYANVAAGLGDSQALKVYTRAQEILRGRGYDVYARLVDADGPPDPLEELRARLIRVK